MTWLAEMKGDCSIFIPVKLLPLRHQFQLLTDTIVSFENCPSRANCSLCGVNDGWAQMRAGFQSQKKFDETRNLVISILGDSLWTIYHSQQKCWTFLTWLVENVLLPCNLAVCISPISIYEQFTCVCTWRWHWNKAGKLSALFSIDPALYRNCP